MTQAHLWPTPKLAVDQAFAGRGRAETAPVRVLTAWKGGRAALVKSEHDAQSGGGQPTFVNI